MKIEYVTRVPKEGYIEGNKIIISLPDNDKFPKELAYVPISVWRGRADVVPHIYWAPFYGYIKL
jgi:hypothetical protein